MVKKRQLYLCGTIGLAIFLVAACSCLKPKAYDLCQGSEVNTSGCPSVRVEVLPAFFPDSPGDHTYIKFLKGNGQWQSLHCFGRCNGGNELPDTRSNTMEDNEKIIRYMADQAPCKWPHSYYLIIGVCHQLANRGLFHTGNIVKNARMYKWTSFVYHTYGACLPGLEEYCMNNCLIESAQAGTWKPGSPSTCPPAEMARPAEPETEYQLYIRYFGDMKVTKAVKDMAGLYKAYRYALLELHVRQRLGDAYVSKYLPILRKGQDDLLERKEMLNRRLLDAKVLSEDIIDDYNNLFNESLKGFQAQFRERKDLYEQFFGLKYDEKIDMRIFKPME